MSLTKPIAERFWPKVDKRGPDDCWNWQGAKDGFGYGRIGSGGKYGRALPTHRVAYELVVGPIPAGLHIDHLCSNPSCVNPAHLEPVTPGENVARGYERLGIRPGPRTLKSHCPQGHPYAGDNLRINPRGHQVCRQCERIKAAAFGRKKRAERRAQLGPYVPPRPTHCIHGHAFDEANTYVYIDSKGRMSRNCRACAARRMRERNARIRAAFLAH